MPWVNRTFYVPDEEGNRVAVVRRIWVEPSTPETEPAKPKQDNAAAKLAADRRAAEAAAKRTTEALRLASNTMRAILQQKTNARARKNSILEFRRTALIKSQTQRDAAMDKKSQAMAIYYERRAKAAANTATVTAIKNRGAMATPKDGAMLERLIAEARTGQLADKNDPNMLDSAYVTDLINTYSAYEERVRTDYEKAADNVMKKGKWDRKNQHFDNYDAAVAEMNKPEFIRLRDEYARLHGASDVKGPVGTFGAATKTYDDITAAQRQFWWNEAKNRTFQTIRQFEKTGMKDEAAAVFKDWDEKEKYLHDAAIHEIDPAKTSSRMVRDPVDGEYKLIPRTPQEELEFRRTEYMAEMKRQYSEWRQKSELSTRLTLRDLRDDPESFRQKRDSEMLLTAMTNLGVEDTPKGYRDTENLIREAMRVWDAENKRYFDNTTVSLQPGWQNSPFDSPMRGTPEQREGQSKYSAAWGQAYRRFYDLLGKETPSVFDVVPNEVPLMQGVVNFFGMWFGGIGSGVKVGLSASQGAPAELVWSGGNISYKDLPEHVQKQANEIAAASLADPDWVRSRELAYGEAGLSLGPSVVQERMRREAWDFAVKKVGAAWVKTPGGQIWADKNNQLPAAFGVTTGRTPNERKRMQDELTNFINLFYKKGMDPVNGRNDPLIMAQALTEYGTAMFTPDSVAANLLTAIAFDPTNALPLKATTWAARLAYANRVIETSKNMTLLQRQVANIKKVHTWTTVSEPELRFDAAINKAGHQLTQGVDPKLIREVILTAMMGITDKTGRDRAVRKMLIDVGINPENAMGRNLLSLAEEAILKRFERAHIDYKSFAKEAEEGLARDTAQRNAAQLLEMSIASAADVRTRALEKIALDAHQSAFDKAMARQQVDVEYYRFKVAQEKIAKKAGVGHVPDSTPQLDAAVAAVAASRKPTIRKKVVTVGTERPRRVKPAEVVTPEQAVPVPQEGGRVLSARERLKGEIHIEETPTRREARLAAVRDGAIIKNFADDDRGAALISSFRVGKYKTYSRQSGGSVRHGIAFPFEGDTKFFATKRGKELEAQLSATRVDEKAGGRLLFVEDRISTGWVIDPIDQTLRRLTPEEILEYKAESVALRARFAKPDQKAIDEALVEIEEEARRQFAVLNFDREGGNWGLNKEGVLERGDVPGTVKDWTPSPKQMIPDSAEAARRAGARTPTAAAYVSNEFRAVEHIRRKLAALHRKVYDGKMTEAEYLEALDVEIKTMGIRRTSPDIDTELRAKGASGGSDATFGRQGALDSRTGEVFTADLGIIDIGNALVDDIVMPNGELDWAAFGSYYKTFSLLTDGVDDIASRTVMDPAMRRSMTPESFADLLRAYGEYVEGPSQFRAAGVMIFAMFHMTILDKNFLPRMRDLHIMAEHVLQADPMNLYARMWLVMEKRSGIEAMQWMDKYTFADVENAFQWAAMITTRLHPNLALAMIPNGPFARAISPHYGFTRNLDQMSASRSRLFTPAPEKYTDFMALEEIRMIGSRNLSSRKDPGIGMRRASKVIHFIAERYGEVSRRQSFANRTVDAAIVNSSFSSPELVSEEWLFEIRSLYIKKMELEFLSDTRAVRGVDGRFKKRSELSFDDLARITERFNQQFDQSFWFNKFHKTKLLQPEFDAEIRALYSEMYWKNQITHDNPGLHTMAFYLTLQSSRLQIGRQWEPFALSYLKHMKAAGAEAQGLEVVNELFHAQKLAQINESMVLVIKKNFDEEEFMPEWTGSKTFWEESGLLPSLAESRASFAKKVKDMAEEEAESAELHDAFLRSDAQWDAIKGGRPVGDIVGGKRTSSQAGHYAESSVEEVTQSIERQLEVLNEWSYSKTSVLTSSEWAKSRLTTSRVARLPHLREYPGSNTGVVPIVIYPPQHPLMKKLSGTKTGNMVPSIVRDPEGGLLVAEGTGLTEVLEAIKAIDPKTLPLSTRAGGVVPRAAHANLQRLMTLYGEGIQWSVREAIRAIDLLDPHVADWTRLLFAREVAAKRLKTGFTALIWKTMRTEGLSPETEALITSTIKTIRSMPNGDEVLEEIADKVGTEFMFSAVTQYMKRAGLYDELAISARRNARRIKDGPPTGTVSSDEMSELAILKEKTSINSKLYDMYASRKTKVWQANRIKEIQAKIDADKAAKQAEYDAREAAADAADAADASSSQARIDAIAFRPAAAATPSPAAAATPSPVDVRWGDRPGASVVDSTPEIPLIPNLSTKYNFVGEFPTPNYKAAGGHHPDEGTSIYTQFDYPGPNGFSFPHHGPKVHLSIAPANMSDTISLVDRIARAYGLSYKYVSRIEFMTETVDRTGRILPHDMQNGKSFAIYLDPANAHEIVAELGARLDEAGIKNWESVAPDRQVGDSPIWSRWSSAYAPRTPAESAIDNTERAALDGGYSASTPDPFADLGKAQPEPAQTADGFDAGGQMDPRIEELALSGEVTEHLSRSERLLNALTNMTPEQWLNREIKRARRSYKASSNAAEKKAAFDRIKMADRALRLLEVQKKGGSLIPHAARQSFARASRMLMEDQIDAAFARNRVAPFVFNYEGAIREQGRSEHVLVTTADVDPSLGQVRMLGDVSEVYTTHGARLDALFNTPFTANMLAQHKMPVIWAGKVTPLMLLSASDEFKRAMTHGPFRDFFNWTVSRMDLRAAAVGRPVTGNGPRYGLTQYMSDRVVTRGDYYDAHLYEQHDQLFASEIRFERGWGATTVTDSIHKRGKNPRDPIAEVLDDEMAVVIAKARIAAEHGFDIHRYNEARRVLKRAMVRKRESVKLLRKATKDAMAEMTRRGLFADQVAPAEWDRIWTEVYEAAYDVRWKAKAREEAFLQYEKLARGKMYGSTHEDILREFERLYGSDSLIRGEKPKPISLFQRKTLEKALETHLGVDSWKNDEAVIRALSPRGQTPPFENRAKMRDWLQRHGVWTPRAADQVVSVGESWSIKDEYQYFIAHWHRAPEWADWTLMRVGEKNYDMLHINEIYGDNLRRWGGYSRNMDARIETGLLSKEELVRVLSEGNDELEIAAMRDLETMRKYVAQRYGELVVDVESGAFHSMPWLMKREELRSYVINRTKQGLDPMLPRDAKAVDVINEMMEKWLGRNFDEVAMAGKTMTHGDMLQMASAMVGELLDHPIWLQRGRDWTGNLLRSRAWLIRMAVMSNPAFAASNVVDSGIKEAWATFQTRSFRSSYVSRDAQKLTYHHFGLGEGSQLLGNVSEHGFGKIQKAWDGNDVFDSALRRIGDTLVGVAEIPAEIAGVAERGAKLRMAQGMYDRAYAKALRRLKDPKVADAVAREWIGKEVSRMWPTVGNGPLERFFNMIVPFASYQFKNHVLFIGEIAARPAVFNYLQRIGDAIEQINREHWAEEHPKDVLEDRLARLIELPWAPGIFFDFGTLSDASRGLKPLFDAAKSPQSLEKMISPWLRLVSVNEINGALALANSIGFGGRRGWEPVLDKYGEPTGRYREVVLPFEAPWGGEATFAGSFWLADLAQTSIQDLSAGKTFSAQGFGEVVAKLLFYGGGKSHDRGAGLNEYYRMLKEVDADAAKVFLKTMDGYELQDYWDERSKAVKNYDPAAYALGDEPKEPAKWLWTQTKEFQQKIRDNLDEKEAMSRKWDHIIWSLTPGTEDYYEAKIEAGREWYAFYRMHPEMYEYETASRTPGDWTRLLDNWKTDALMTSFFARKAPKEDDFATDELFLAAVKEYKTWQVNYLKAFPTVAERLAKDQSTVDAVWKDVEEGWWKILDDVGVTKIALQAAREAENYDLVEQLYTIQDLTYEKLTREVAVSYFDPTTDYPVLDWRERKARASAPPTRYAPLATREGLLPRMKVLPDFSKWVWDRASKEKRDEMVANQWYGRKMKAVISKAKGSDDFGKTFVEELKADVPLMNAYFARPENAGKREEWAANDRYIRIIGQYGKLMEAGKFNAAGRYFDAMPDDVKARYYKKHPDRAAKNAANHAYMNYMKQWVAFFKRRDYSGGAKFFETLPDWVQNRYYKNHPDYKNGKGSSPYSRAMGKWVELLKAKKKDEAKAYFDALPDAYKKRYYSNHPEQELRNDVKRVGQLADYFAADDANRIVYLAANPEFARWLRAKNTNAETRRMMITVAYQSIPKEDEWLRRVFREKYPEVFSKEATGLAALKKVYTALASHRSMMPAFEKWVAAIWATYAENAKHTATRPKPVVSDHRRQRVHGTDEWVKPHRGKSAAWVRLHSG